MSSLPLPEDIIVNILSRLPVKSILRFRCVCKSWCRLFGDPDFIKFHLDRETEKENFSLLWSYDGEISSTDYNYEYSSSSLSSILYNETVRLDFCVDPLLEMKFYRDYQKQMRWRTCSDNVFSKEGFNVINSCNGVVCMTASSIIALWNPCTRETMEIRCTNGSNIGFGYDLETGEFKMVELSRIDPIKRKRRGTCIQILKIGRIVSLSIHLINQIHGKSFQKYLAKVLLMKLYFSKELSIDRLWIKSVTKVVVLGGMLALTHTLYGTRTEIWVLKDYGGTNSWTQLCIINLQMICEHPVTRLTFIRSFKN
ncbi:hypothetical protein C5167_003342, partial [Papaver somniferum]